MPRASKPPPRTNRTKLTKKMKLRIDGMRKMLALGWPHYRIRDELGLTAKQYEVTRARYLELHSIRDSAEMYAHHEAGVRTRQHEALRLYQMVRDGVPHPRAYEKLPHGHGYYPAWLILPNPKTAIQALRLAEQMDVGLLELADRLGLIGERDTSQEEVWFKAFRAQTPEDQLREVTKLEHLLRVGVTSGRRRLVTIEAVTDGSKEEQGSGASEASGKASGRSYVRSRRLPAREPGGGQATGSR